VEECLSFTFSFRADGLYSLQWFREGLTVDNEQQHGKWKVVADKIWCETLPPPQEVDERLLRYANAGRTFELPVEDVLSKTTTGNDLCGWEMSARGLTSRSVVDECPSDLPDAPISASMPYTVDLAEASDHAHLVEIDGELHEVCRDIVQNWPENEWGRLMQCRLRFGTGAER
jgi:hypothetical protein